MRRNPPQPWRDHLTADERLVIEAAEQALATWQRLKRSRADIISRAAARARAGAVSPNLEHQHDH